MTITTEQLKSMNDKQAFDYVREFLLKQGMRSHRGRPTDCAYRGYGGLKCAVGCLIPDEKYLPWFEGESVTALEERGCLEEIGIDHLSVHMLDDLQSLHDIHIPFDWRVEFEKMSCNFDKEGNYN